jgi:hypothetical protein
MTDAFKRLRVLPLPSRKTSAERIERSSTGSIRRCSDEVAGIEDAIEGARAFAERRRPIFKKRRLATRRA